MRHGIPVGQTAACVPERSGWTDEERRTIRATRWWFLAELRAAVEPVLPAWVRGAQPGPRHQGATLFLLRQEDDFDELHLL